MPTMASKLKHSTNRLNSMTYLQIPLSLFIFIQITVQCCDKNRPPCEMDRRRGSATSDHQFAYFTPGDTVVYRYQLSTQKWEQLPPCLYTDSALVIIEGSLTAVGGYGGSRKKLFTLKREWVEEYPPMNNPHTSPAVASTSDGEYVFVIGQSDTTVELLHVRSRTWYKVTDIPQALTSPSTTACSHQLHVISASGDGYSCSLQTLPSSNQPIKPQSINLLSWTPLPRLPVTLSTAATLCGQLIIVGGIEDRAATKFIHQLIDERWVMIGSMSHVGEMCLVASPSPDKIIVGGRIHRDHSGTCCIYHEVISIEECVGTCCAY